MQYCPMYEEPRNEQRITIVFDKQQNQKDVEKS
jgi:hypothetical protein